MAEIRVMRADKEESFPLDDTFTVGRLSTNSLQLDDEAVSREHATVEKSGTGFTVKDLESRNGTFVERGGRTWRVEGSLGLQAGDVIKVGSARMTFISPEESGEGFDPGATVIGRVVPAPRKEGGR